MYFCVLYISKNLYKFSTLHKSNPKLWGSQVSGTREIDNNMNEKANKNISMFHTKTF
jgi:hypothetical protein